MLTTHVLPVDLWPVVIKAVFKGDLLLLRKYHVAAPCSLSLAVADTFLAMRRTTTPAYVLYGLRNAQGQWVGMAGVEPAANLLVTFGLGHAHRTRENVAQLSSLIDSLLDPARWATCVLYERNGPARAFLRRLGFTEDKARVAHPTNGQPGVVFTR